MPDTQPSSLRVRPDYFGPARDDARRVDVGRRGMVAVEAHELVAALDVAADAALPSLTGATRITTTNLPRHHEERNRARGSSAP